MRSQLRLFATRRPATTAAMVAALAATLAIAVLVGVHGSSTSAIMAAALAGVAMAVLAGAIFGALLREHAAAFDAAALRIAELAAACGLADETRQPGTARADLLGLDRDLTAIGRAHRSLLREREQSQGALDQQIGRQAEFYAQLSHELRSPLNAILGYASLAIEDAEGGHTADLPQDLRKIRGAGQNLLALIDNLLQLAEDRTGRESVARVPFQLGEVLTQAASEHGEAAPGVEIQLAGGAGRETLFGNRAKVARAVGSVIDDAIRSRGACRIAVATRPSPTHNACVEVVVEIEGAAGARASGGRESLTRHLADRLAAAVSGNLTVEPLGDAKWVYVLRLPFDVDAAVSRPAQRPIPLGQVPVAGVGTKSALVVDDDPATIDLMTRWLERGGYSVQTAANADQGFALAQAMAPDIVLLDALMPGRTGYDILPDLTALPALRDTPILLVTVDDDRQRGLAAGASDYVRKPVTESRLREIIAVYEKDLEGEVLIVEDERDAAELLARTVHRLGFSTRLAADGAEGLAAVRERIPTAILLDLNMPNLNGFDFIETLARSKVHAAIPLIVLSGQQLSVAQHHRLLAAGCRYYMKGNAAPREIAESLREMVA